MNRKQYTTKICKKYNIKYRIIDLKSHGGYSYPKQGKIFISKHLSRNKFVSTLFHEIAHCLNYRDKKYFKFHSSNCSKTYLKKMALRAEIYTEQRARQLAEANGFYNYKDSYFYNEECKKWLSRYYSLDK